MKKLISFIAIFAALFTQAQTTVPRFGTDKYHDNTGAQLKYALITTTDVTSATIDTMLFTPNAWETIWRPSANLADSCVIKFSSTTTTYHVGDIFSIFLTKGTGAGRVRFGGSQYISSTTNSTGIAIPANKVCMIRLRYNGSFWVEEYHMVSP